MKNISNVDNYYNTFDATKGYTELLFRAGKVLQSKEVNELQSVLKEQIKNVGNTILTDGDKIEGCQLIVDGNIAKITKGKIYLNGNIREIPCTAEGKKVGYETIKITGKGTEIIGAVIEKEVVTPAEDPDLYDKASGFDNYNRDGAYRLRENVKLVVNDTNATILFTLVDGKQTKVNVSEDLTQLDKVNLTLARRTFDESGNYKVNGLEITDRKKFDTKTNKVFVSVEPGKAYVKGFEVMKLASTTIGLDVSDNHLSILNEPKIYNTGTSDYRLNHPYTFDEVIIADIEVTESIGRGSDAGGKDTLPKQPVKSIKRITGGTGSPEYKATTDYILNGNTVDWSPDGQEPGVGTTYTVTYTYSKTLVKDVDYKLTTDPKTNETVIKFIGSPKPVDGSTFNINYKYNLFRRDVISIDKDGNFLITKGQPNILDLVESPSVTDTEVLILGSVLINPIAKDKATGTLSLKDLQIINNRTQAIPMLDLYKILDRLSNLEYNQAVSDLDKEAVEGESATQLIGVFTDGFLGLTKADLGHPDWDASIDFSSNELTLPYTEVLKSLKSCATPETWGEDKSNLKRYSSNYTEVVELEQPFYTGIMRVNAYDAFPKTPSVRISPDIDNWIETEEITVNGGNLPAVTLRRWWYAKSSSWAMEEKAKWEALGFKDGGASIGSKRYYSTTVDVISKEVVDNAITYMRTNRVDVTVSNLMGSEDNVIVTFDGFPVTMSAERGYEGTDRGTLRADVNGVAKGHFTIPEKTECGTKEVRAYAKSKPSLFGTANYTANGTKRIVTNTVFKQKVSAEPYDPVAQSFQFAEDKYLTAISVYFKDKDSNEPITVQIRNTVNGYPGTVIYAEEVIQGKDIKVDQEQKIVFSEPVYCNAKEMYCFTILSNSNIDSVQIAETNRNDVNSGVAVAKNPYLAGTMFSSSNALTWTAHQDMDMRFKLYAAKFETSGTVEFKVDVDNSPSRFVIASEEYIPAGCIIAWSYKYSEEDTWKPCEKYTEVEFKNEGGLGEITEIYLKATFLSKPNISGFIDIESLQLVSIQNKNKAVYVSRTVNVPNDYNDIKIILDIEQPANTNFNVYYQANGERDWTSISSNKNEVISNKSKRFYFEKKLGSTKKTFKTKVELTTVKHTSVPKAKNLKCIMKKI